MSVLAQVKKFSSDPETPDYDRAYLAEGGDGGTMASETEEMMQTGPIPGQSLTKDPEQRSPHEGPPQFTDQKEFLDHLFLQWTKDEVLPNILDSMAKGLPVEDVAMKLLQGQMRKGNVNVDLMMLCIEPAIYMLIAFATYAEIDPVLYPEEDFDAEGSREDMASKFHQASAKLRGEGTDDGKEGITVEDLRAPAVLPQSLMKRTLAAVKGNK